MLNPRHVSEPAQAPVGSLSPPSRTETMAATDAEQSGLDATLAGTAAAKGLATLSTTAGGRVTVLPQVIAEDSGALRLEHSQRSRYTAIRPLGSGGMGEVELSEDLDIGRRVALKRLPEATDSPSSVARFVDEVRTMGALDHPHITPIYDVGRDEEGRLFFTMKYVEGETVEDLIERLIDGDAQTHAQYPFARRLDIFVGILHALDYAHARGILHRDIKPANIMLGKHGEVRLVDWGIARRGLAAENPESSEPLDGPDSVPRPDMTHAGVLLGTPMYMSPEQARGDRDAVDARSDLYAAFVVLFELLTLRRYVDDDGDVYSVLQDVLEGEGPWRDWDTWNHPAQPTIPSELRHFLRRGLRRDPERRFQSAAEAQGVLEHARSGEIDVQCQITFMKHHQYRMIAFAESRPQVFFVGMFAMAMSVLGVLALAGVGVASLV